MGVCSGWNFLIIFAGLIICARLHIFHRGNQLSFRSRDLVLVNHCDRSRRYSRAEVLLMLNFNSIMPEPSDVLELKFVTIMRSITTVNDVKSCTIS